MRRSDRKCDLIHNLLCLLEHPKNRISSGSRYSPLATRFCSAKCPYLRSISSICLPISNPKEDVTSAEYLDGRVREYFAKQFWKDNIQAISSAVAKRFQILLGQTITEGDETWKCVYAAECSREYEVKVWLTSLQGNRRYRIYVNIFKLHLCHFLWDRVVELEKLIKNDEKYISKIQLFPIQMLTFIL